MPLKRLRPFSLLRNNEVDTAGGLRVLGQRTQLLGKRYRSSKQWFSVWPSILAVHPIPRPTVVRGFRLQQSVGCVVPRDTFNATALNASKIGFVHRPLGHSSQLEHVLDTMKLADGRSSSFLGRGKMKINLGDRELAHTIWVADIEPEGILGLDFFQQYDCQLALKDG